LPIKASLSGLSPDGKTALAGCGQCAFLIDVKTGKVINRVVGHIGGVSHLRFSPDGRRLASGDDDGAAIVWDLATGRCLRLLSGHAQGVASLAWSPDGRTLAVGDGGRAGSGSRHAFVHLWDSQTGKLQRRFAAHMAGVLSMEFRDAQTLVTTGYDERVRWWDSRTGRRLGQHRDLDGPLLIPGGRGAFLTDDGSLWALRLTEPAPVRVAQSGGRSRPTAVLLKDGREILVRGRKTGFLRFAFPSGKLLAKDEPDHFKDYSDYGRGVLSPEGHLYAIGAFDIFVFGLPSGKKLAHFKGPTDLPSALAFSPDGKRLAAAYGGTRIYLWDTSRLKGKKP
jgi:WD40 repeat protein